MRAARTSAILLALLLALGTGDARGQGFLGATWGTNFGDPGDHTYTVYDAFGRPYNYVAPDPTKYQHVGGVLEFRGRLFSLRLGVQFALAGDAKNPPNSRVGCTSDVAVCDTVFYSGLTTSFVIGHVDILLHPPLEDEITFLPYLLLAPEGRFRFNDPNVLDRHEADVGEVVGSLAVGLGVVLQYPDWFDPSRVRGSFFTEVRYGLPLGSILPDQDFNLGGVQVSLDAPYEELKFTFRAGWTLRIW